jgi:hypothetical protein
MAENKSFDDKLLAVIDDLKAPKGQYNSFGKYHYRSCEDIVEAVKPLLSRHGLRMKISDRVVLVGSSNYVKATVMVTDGEKVDFATGYAREAEKQAGMADSQITGSTSSYARKYALNGMFCIDDTKDADTDEQHNEVQNRPYVPPERKNEVPGPSENQKNKIRELGEKLKLTPESVEARIAELATTSDALKAIAKLQELVNSGNK